MQPLPPQASPPPFGGAGELCALGSAVAGGVASVLWVRALRARSAADAALFKNAVAAAVLVAAALIGGSDLGGGPTGAGEAPWLAASGAVALGLGSWLYLVALARLGVVATQILVQTTPALTAVAAIPVYGEHLTAAQGCGVAAVMAGGILVQLRRDAGGAAGLALPVRGALAAGRLAAVAGVACFVAGNLMARRGLQQTGLLTAAAWRLGGGAAVLVMLRVLGGEARAVPRVLASAASWRSLLMPTLLGAVLWLTLFGGGLKWAKQGVASSLAAAMPLFSIPLAQIVLRERPGWRGWAGAALVLGGVALLSLAGG